MSRAFFASSPKSAMHSHADMECRMYQGFSSSSPKTGIHSRTRTFCTPLERAEPDTSASRFLYTPLRGHVRMYRHCHALHNEKCECIRAFRRPAPKLRYILARGHFARHSTALSQTQAHPAKYIHPLTGRGMPLTLKIVSVFIESFVDRIEN